MSQELVRLSKLPVQGILSSPSSTVRPAFRSVILKLLASSRIQMAASLPASCR